MIPACRDSSRLYSEAVKADKEIYCSCVCKNHGVTTGSFNLQIKFSNQQNILNVSEIERFNEHISVWCTFCFNWYPEEMPFLLVWLHTPFGCHCCLQLIFQTEEKKNTTNCYQMLTLYLNR